MLFFIFLLAAIAATLEMINISAPLDLASYEPVNALEYE